MFFFNHFYLLSKSLELSGVQWKLDQNKEKKEAGCGIEKLPEKYLRNSGGGRKRRRRQHHRGIPEWALAEESGGRGL